MWLINLEVILYKYVLLKVKGPTPRLNPYRFIHAIADKGPWVSLSYDPKEYPLMMLSWEEITSLEVTA